jgi:hypothetical protein
MTYQKLMNKEIARTVNLAEVYSGLDMAWWKNNDKTAYKYEMKSFSVKRKKWNKWKENNVGVVIENIYQIKTNDAAKNLQPLVITATNKIVHGFEAIMHWKETQISKDTIDISALEIWWAPDCILNIDLFHKELVKTRISSTEKSSVYMVVMDDGSLDLKSFDINVPEIDIKMNYGDSWFDKHDHLVEALTVKPKKGIALLHGLPGTGKSMYIRYLISLLSESRTMIYLPNQMIDSITDPAFIPLMADYPNSILIIEDADEAIKSRKTGGHTVDKLLNLSDGILSDFLGMQIICTFNSDITTIDEALLRKGRLILKHKFEKLPKQQAQRLSNHLGFKTPIGEDMTLAEIYNQEDVFGGQTDEPTKIGFGR